MSESGTPQSLDQFLAQFEDECRRRGYARHEDCWREELFSALIEAKDALEAMRNMVGDRDLYVEQPNRRSTCQEVWVRSLMALVRCKMLIHTEREVQAAKRGTALAGGQEGAQ